MKKLVLVCLCFFIVSCDNKKALEISSADSYEAIAAKTELQDRKDKDTYYLYSSKDSLKSFDNIPFDQNYSDLFFELSKDGKLCGASMSASTDKGFSKEEIINLSNKTKKTLEKYGKYKESISDDFLIWEPDIKNGIKYISTSLISHEDNRLLMLSITTNNERYCNPEVMEHEKKGEWITRQTIDDIDDTKMDTAIKFSNSIDKGTLHLLCKNNDLILSIGVREYLGEQDSEVAFRLDKDKAIISAWRTIPKIKSVIYRGDTKELFRKMLKAKELITRITTLNNSVTLKFNLDKIDYATKDIVKACNVNSSLDTKDSGDNTVNQSNSSELTKTWTILIAATTNIDNAEKLLAKLRKANYTAYTRSEDKIIRVFVGPFIDKSVAGKVNEQIQQQFNEKGIIREFKPSS